MLIQPRPHVEIDIRRSCRYELFERHNPHLIVQSIAPGRDMPGLVLWHVYDYPIPLRIKPARPLPCQQWISE